MARYVAFDYRRVLGVLGCHENLEFARMRQLDVGQSLQEIH